MELKQVLIVLGPKWDKQAEKLEKRLREGEVCSVRFGGETGRDWDAGKIEAAVRQNLFGRSADRTDSVVITDNSRLAAELEKSGAVCLGCDDGEGSFFEGAELITDAPGSLDVLTIEEYLLHMTGRPVTITVTERLIIREITERDLPELYQVDSRFEPERMAAYVRHAYRFYGYGLWGVFLYDGTLVGCCGFADCSDCFAGQLTFDGREDEGCKYQEKYDNPGVRLELQYAVKSIFRRQGYGSEMCCAALAYARDRLQADEIWVRIALENQASAALAEKLGFVKVCEDSSGVSYMKMNLQG